MTNLAIQWCLVRVVDSSEAWIKNTQLLDIFDTSQSNISFFYVTKNLL